MAKFLANENVPLRAVEAGRAAGHDISWMSEIAPGSDDKQVLALAFSENRVLLTFDKDFGELVFRLGQSSSCGIILLRPRLASPDHVASFVANVIAQPIDWEKNFSVAEEGRIRVAPLPA